VLPKQTYIYARSGLEPEQDWPRRLYCDCGRAQNKRPLQKLGSNGNSIDTEKCEEALNIGTEGAIVIGRTLKTADIELE